jgi:hypothetical protein
MKPNMSLPSQAQQLGVYGCEMVNYAALPNREQIQHKRALEHICHTVSGHKITALQELNT